MRRESNSEVFRCSFCNKSQTEVRKLIAGPNTFICDECIDVCNEILVDDGMESPHVAALKRKEQEEEKMISPELKEIWQYASKLPYSEKWILLQLLIDKLMQAHLENPM